MNEEIDLLELHLEAFEKIFGNFVLPPQNRLKAENDNKEITNDE